MKDFLKTFFAALLSNFITCGILAVALLFFLIAFALSFSGSRGNDTVVQSQSFLVLNLNVSINDSPWVEDISTFMNGDLTERIALWDVLTAIENAADDWRITGIFITGNLVSKNYGSGYAAIEELRRALVKFQTSGKPVYAFLENPSQRDYYLSSVANKIFMHPMGVLPLVGFSSENLYFAEAFEKYGIGVQTTKVGKYKSAVEPFLEKKMSEPAREQSRELLISRWTLIVNDIIAARKNFQKTNIPTLANGAIFTAEEAQKIGLVDNLLHFDEVIKKLISAGKKDRMNKTESFAQVDINDYIALCPKRIIGPEIAIVYAEGDIQDEGDVDAVNGTALSELLRHLRNKEEVAGVILRVNSPGGSAFASEQIQREMRLLNESGKPVVVSMGSLAASGGYWISAYSNKIFAEKTTITGSIGVFGLMFNIGELAKKIGVNFDGVQIGEFAGIDSISRPKNDTEMAVLQKHTDAIYAQFLAKVAEGRTLDIKHVGEIAQGRVWMGTAAKELGLIDQFGGLKDAVHSVTTDLGIGNYFHVRQYPEKMNKWEFISELLESPDTRRPLARSQNGTASRITRQLEKIHHQLETFDDPQGIYLKMPETFSDANE